MSTSKPIYLDYAATTPVHPDVASAMSECLLSDGNFGNPASRSHIFGWKAEESVETARRQVSDLLGADAREIVWTSGATESNNLAIKGVVAAFVADGMAYSDMHIVSSSIEHKAVLDTVDYLASCGVQVSYVKPNSDGRVAVTAVESALRESTILVSIMHANNETGVINPISEIGALCREKQCLFHTDAAQTCGKLPLDVKAANIDLLSVSAHKFYGPKGMGALYVRRDPKVRVLPQIHGGGHERGMRSGTLATHQIVGLGKAAELAQATLNDTRVQHLRDRFWLAVQSQSGVELNGAEEGRLPGHLNLAFTGVDGETLLMSLRQIAISSGSACMSATMSPSYVLTEMGYSEERAHNSLRFSFGRFTTEVEVDAAIDQLKKALASLHRPSA